MNTPEPEREITVKHRQGLWADIFYATPRAREWLEEVMPTFGRAFHVKEDHRFTLWINPCFDEEKVVVHLQSFNDEPGPITVINNLMPSDALHLHGGMMEDSILRTDSLLPPDTFTIKAGTYDEKRIIDDDKPSPYERPVTEDWTWTTKIDGRWIAPTKAKENLQMVGIQADAIDTSAILGINAGETPREIAEGLIGFLGNKVAEEVAMEIKAILHPYGQ